MTVPSSGEKGLNCYGTAEIVYYHVGAAPGQCQCIHTAKAAAGPGNNCRAIIETDRFFIHLDSLGIWHIKVLVALSIGDLK